MVTKIDECKESLIRSLKDDSKPWTPAFNWAEEKTGVPRLYIFIGAAALCGIYLIFGFAAQILCNLIGVVYPAYVSIKAIETSTKADDTKWLTYWVMFAIVSIFEHFSGFLTSIIPFYWLLKCIFLLWCMVPIENNGSVFVYNRLVRPYFLKHQSTADGLIDKATDKAKEIFEDIVTKKSH